MQTPKRAANLVDTVHVGFKRPRGDKKTVHAVLDGRGLVGKIAAHGIEGDENLSRIESVVAGVLVFRLHRADNHVRNAVHPYGLAHRIALGE